MDAAEILAGFAPAGDDFSDDELAGFESGLGHIADGLRVMLHSGDRWMMATAHSILFATVAAVTHAVKVANERMQQERFDESDEE